MTDTTTDTTGPQPDEESGNLPRAALHADCEKKLKEFEAGWKRAVADYRNLERRVQHEKEEMASLWKELMLREILPIIDHFDQALEHLPKGSAQGWADGIIHIRREFEELLTAHGVKAFGEAGEAFDPQRHEAVEQETTEEAKNAHTIAKVVGKGYQLGERLIRPARVVVYTVEQEK